jgi:O-acetyl-ADP-ribose deacetylase
LGVKVEYIKSRISLVAFFSLVQLSCGINAAETSVTIGDTKIIMMKGDITKLKDIDAIVNASNDGLQHWGGIAEAISKASESNMTDDQKKAYPVNSRLQRHSDRMENFPGHDSKCPVGCAVITPAFDLEDNAIKNIIHVTGPKGNNPDKQNLLHCAYLSGLMVAKANGLKSVAFPAISTAIFKYDIKKATPVAFRAVRNFILQNVGAIDEVRFVLFSDADLAVYQANAPLLEGKDLVAEAQVEVLDKSPIDPSDSQKIEPIKADSTSKYLIGAASLGFVGFITFLIYLYKHDQLSFFDFKS